MAPRHSNYKFWWRNPRMSNDSISAKLQVSNMKHGGGIRPWVCALTFAPPPPPPPPPYDWLLDSCTQSRSIATMAMGRWRIKSNWKLLDQIRQLLPINLENLLFIICYRHYCNPGLRPGHVKVYLSRSPPSYRKKIYISICFNNVRHVWRKFHIEGTIGIIYPKLVNCKLTFHHRLSTPIIVTDNYLR